MAGGHFDVVEEDRAAADCALAGVFETGGADTRQVHRYQEGTDAVGARLLGAGAGKDHGHVGLVGH
ncbi:hypothetical protein D3C85_1138340 [compost metagenome]